MRLLRAWWPLPARALFPWDLTLFSSYVAYDHAVPTACPGLGCLLRLGCDEPHGRVTPVPRVHPRTRVRARSQVAMATVFFGANDSVLHDRNPRQVA